MNADERESDPEERRELDRLAYQVVGAAYEVGNVLGVGFLEKVYQRALVSELRRRGVQAEGEVPVAVRYKGEAVEEYRVDILVEGKLIVETKCVDEFCDAHLAQCLNYLRATGLRLALLVNFQRPKVEWRRVVYNL
ncbi:MAG: GxxExxY protein [Armatimonadetes bacterium]|nr:GxxExxY protein [Armatimonadota bacterium]